MPRWITACFVFFFSLTLLTAKARTVDDIISKYLQEMAGNHTLDSIHNLKVKGEVVEVQLHGKRDVHSFSFTLHTENGKAEVTERNGLTPELLKGILVAKRFHADLKKRESLSLEGIAKINGRSCYQIHIKHNDEQFVNYFLDAETWYIIREERCERNGPGIIRTVMDYSEYIRLENVYLLPSVIKTDGKDAYLIKNISVNARMDTTSLVENSSSSGTYSNQ